MSKKTYVFDDHTMDMLENLKKELRQKEVSIIKEAIKNLYESRCEEKENQSLLRDIVMRLERIVNRVEELSYELGRYKERNAILEERLKKILEDGDGILHDT